MEGYGLNTVTHQHPTDRIPHTWRGCEEAPEHRQDLQELHVPLLNSGPWSSVQGKVTLEERKSKKRHKGNCILDVEAIE